MIYLLGFEFHSVGVILVLANMLWTCYINGNRSIDVVDYFQELFQCPKLHTINTVSKLVVYLVLLCLLLFLFQITRLQIIFDSVFNTSF